MNVSAAEILLSKTQESIFLGSGIENFSSLKYAQESLMSILQMSGGGDNQSLFGLYTLLFYTSGLLKDDDTVSQTLKLFCKQGATLHEMPSNMKLLAIFASPNLTKKFLIPVTSLEVKVWQAFLNWTKTGKSEELMEKWDNILKNRLPNASYTWEDKALFYARTLTLFHVQ